jgi:hypothetical protein
MWIVKKDIRMHEGNLIAFFHEERTVESNIQGNIVELYID